METVVTPATARGAIYSVEYLADVMRRHSDRWTQINTLGFELVRTITEWDHLDDTERMRCVENVVAATELVHAEREAER